MNPLSKAFVILVTLLTVALSCFSIAVISRQEAYKKERDEAASKLAVSEAQLKANKALLAEAAGKMDAENNQLLKSNAQLQTLLNTANTNLSTVQFDLNKAKADIVAKDASLEIATANVARATQEREEYNKQYIEALKQSHLDSQKGVESASRIADLSDKLRRTEIDLLRFKEQMVAANKQLEEASKQVSQLESQLGKQKLPTTVSVAATQTIKGSVTTVGEASNGVTLVSVDVGEKDQVVPGMQFTISHGSDYVGTMVVTTVNTETSVGHITNGSQSVSSGDSVYIRGYNQ